MTGSAGMAVFVDGLGGLGSRDSSHCHPSPFGQSIGFALCTLLWVLPKESHSPYLAMAVRGGTGP